MRKLNIHLGNFKLLTDKYIIFIVVLSSFMCCLDSSIVNLALPIMSRELSTTTSSIQWVVTVYIMAISSSILILGRLGDIIGKTEVFKFGLLLFTAGSFLCGLSISLPMLLVFRTIQGFGGAAIMANSNGIITQFIAKSKRGKGLGILSSSVALGIMLGPPISGFVISIFSWKFIFFINIPIGIFTYILATIFFPKSDNINREKFDVIGALILFIAIILLFIYLILGQNIGFRNLLLLIVLVLSFILIFAFIWTENRKEMPLLQLNIFKNKLFILNLLCGFISYVCINAQNILLPFYMQETLKLSPSYAGLYMMIPPFILFLISPLSGALADKIGSELITFLGLTITSFGFFLMTFLNEHSNIIVIIIFISIISFGNGTFQPSNNTLIMSIVNKNMLGFAGGLSALTRNLGGIIGITLATNVLYNRMSYKAGENVVNYIVGRDDIFIYGMKYTYMILSILSVFGAILTSFRIYKYKKLK